MIVSVYLLYKCERTHTPAGNVEYTRMQQMCHTIWSYVRFVAGQRMRLPTETRHTAVAARFVAAENVSE